MIRALIVVAGLVACSGQSEVVLGIATDLQVPATIDEIRLHAYDESGSELVSKSFALSGEIGTGINLPASYALYADGDEPRVKIELEGYKSGSLVVSRRVELQLVADRISFYRLGLTFACIGKLDCGEGASCVEGACVEAALDTRRFPAYAPELVDTVTCDNGFTTYLDTSTDAPLSFSADATACPMDRCFEGTCLAPVVADGTTRTIRGHAVTTWVNSNGVKYTPVDLSSFTPKALVLDGGAFTEYPGSGFADGTFEIPDVPTGPYYLVTGSSYLVDTSSYFDFGGVRDGDPDATPAPNAMFQVSLDGLEPWADGGQIQAFAPDVDMWWFALEGFHPITSGAQSFTATVSTIEPATSNPVFIPNGAAFTWVQLAPRTTTVGGTTVSFMSAVRKYETTSFDQASGANITGTFAPIQSTEALHGVVDMDAWKAVLGYDAGRATAVHPDATTVIDARVTPGVFLDVAGESVGTQYGRLGNTADYLIATVPFSAPNAEVPNLTYGIPTNGGRWASVLTTGASGIVDHRHPAATDPARFYGGVYYDELLRDHVGPITPLLGLVTTPTIEGRDLFAEQTGVGTTPRLEWVAPALGRPNVYSIELWELGVDMNSSPTRSTREFVASLATTETHIVIPPNVLVPGHLYVANINAGFASNPTTPGRNRFPDMKSTIISGVFTP